MQVLLIAQVSKLDEHVDLKSMRISFVDSAVQYVQWKIEIWW